jgi:23S rRNA pseudouridine955/2504/2580 synthase
VTDRPKRGPKPGRKPSPKVGQPAADGSKANQNSAASTARARVRRVRIHEGDAGQRVDNYLMRELKGVPKTRIYRALRKGEVRVDGKRIKPERRLAAGEELRIPPISVADRGPEAEPSESLRDLLAGRVLFEDDHLIVIDKPSGLAVHGGSGLKLGLIEAMRKFRPEERRLELVHRLDRATSGCLMLAKKPSALKALHRQLREGKVTKTYLTLLRGRLPEDKVIVDVALERRTTASGKRQVEVDEDEGRQSRSTFKLLERYGHKASMVEVNIATGRTHQIRVHAQHIGQEVAGDLRYGDLRFNREMRQLGLHRMFLHARSLVFRHPSSDESVRVDAPMGDELRSVIDALEAQH